MQTIIISCDRKVEKKRGKSELYKNKIKKGIFVFNEGIFTLTKSNHDKMKK